MESKPMKIWMLLLSRLSKSKRNKQLRRKIMVMKTKRNKLTYTFLSIIVLNHILSNNLANVFIVHWPLSQSQSFSNKTLIAVLSLVSVVVQAVANQALPKLLKTKFQMLLS